MGSIKRILNSIFGKGGESQAERILYFESNFDAFEYAKKFLGRDLVGGNNFIGLVQGFTVLGSEVPFWIQQLWKGRYSIQIATTAGPQLIEGCGSISDTISGRHPIPGDLVSVNAACFKPQAHPTQNYFQIRAILKPALSAEDHMFVPIIRADFGNEKT